MRTTYRQLISEHEKIEACAALRLVDVADDTIASAELAVQLGELADFVDEHIEVEDGTTRVVDPGRLSGPWSEAWAEGKTAFLRLRGDW